MQKKIKFLTVIFSVGLSLFACEEDKIGQACTFHWPDLEAGDKDCSQLPACAPLQSSSQDPSKEPANSSCPIDCIQSPSLSCPNLICVATQVHKDATVGNESISKWQVINGQCNQNVTRNECQTKTAFGCMGYCTKTCLTDASCPKGYACSQMAPFKENLRCSDERLWGGDVADPKTEATRCTDNCLPAGTDLGNGSTCPSSIEGDPNYPYDYSLCDFDKYRRCCTCMCNRFCPLLVKKFCRKIEWDQSMFPKGRVPVSTTNCTPQ
jgi:hypothetical protein